MGLAVTSEIQATRAKYVVQRALVAVFASILVVAMFPQSAFTVETTEWPVSQLGAGSSLAGHLDVSDQLVVWASGSLKAEISVWTADDMVSMQIASDGRWNFVPKASGDRIVWLRKAADWDGISFDTGDVYTWAVGDLEPTQITSGEGDSAPQISGNRIVWCRGGNVYTWVVGDLEPSQITSNGGNAMPQVSGDRVAWIGSDEIYTWTVGDVSPTRLTSNDLIDSGVQVSGDRVVWKGEIPYTPESGYAFSEVYTWAAGDSGPTMVTDHGYHPGTYSSDGIGRVLSPQVSGDRIVWHERETRIPVFPPTSPPTTTDGDSEIFTWEFGDTAPTKITDNQYDDSYAQIDGDRVVWRAENGPNHEVSTWSVGDAVQAVVASTDVDVTHPKVSGDRVVWNSASRVFTAYLKYTPIAGTSRYDTALKTSQAAFADGEADCVVIATGANWPDALGGAALASAKNGPILLTAPTALTSGITDEIDRLGATEAYILGGTGAVSQSVETALIAKMGAANVHRIWGTSRYQTAEAIAAATIAELEAGTGYDGTAFVATAGNFPDALAASPLAAAKGWPIFLCNPAGDPPTAIMESLGVTKALILGGTGAVSATQEATLEAAFPGNVDRLWGASRYATGVAVATYGVQHAGLEWNGLAMSTGQNFPDALAGGVLAARNGSVMLLTAPDTLPTDVSAKLTAERDGIAKVYYLGGTGAISQDVRDEVSSILQ